MSNAINNPNITRDYDLLVKKFFLFTIVAKNYNKYS
jgi:hypothetical protein